MKLNPTRPIKIDRRMLIAFPPAFLDQRMDEPLHVIYTFTKKRKMRNDKKKKKKKIRRKRNESIFVLS